MTRLRKNMFEDILPLVLQNMFKDVLRLVFNKHQYFKNTCFKLYFQPKNVVPVLGTLDHNWLIFTQLGIKT